MKPRRVAILQSNYIPWKGYFDLIHDVDLFVFYDDVQFTKSDWRHRQSNQDFARCSYQWLSVPVGQKLDQDICEVELKSKVWQSKHWRTLEQNYAKCAHFARYREYFEHVYLGTTWRTLSELNKSLVRHVSHAFLGIGAEIADSRAYSASGSKLERLLDLVGKTGATSYLSGPTAKDYIIPERFAERGVELRWKDYSGYPDYPQRFPPFEHGLSVVDLLFNVGPEAPWFIWGWRGGRRTIATTRQGQAAPD